MYVKYGLKKHLVSVANPNPYSNLPNMNSKINIRAIFIIIFE